MLLEFEIMLDGMINLVGCDGLLHGWNAGVWLEWDENHMILTGKDPLMECSGDALGWVEKRWWTRQNPPQEKNSSRPLGCPGPHVDPLRMTLYRWHGWRMKWPTMAQQNNSLTWVNNDPQNMTHRIDGCPLRRKRRVSEGVWSEPLHSRYEALRGVWSVPSASVREL